MQDTENHLIERLPRRVQQQVIGRCEWLASLISRQQWTVFAAVQTKLGFGANMVT